MNTSITDRAYGRTVELGMPFDEAVTSTTEALKTQGFGVLTTIEVDKVLKSKLDVDRGRYTILGACNPGFAYQALETDTDIGLLLPCNVVVREENDRRYVTFVDPQSMLAAAGDSPDLQKIATDVKSRLDAAAETLAHL
ncbi:MAG TPA: DUF302 domain-containing protein [Thermomicrobiales bacterium]|nr:DUF302 domain-containing protein [Thermomicrobiales bacterium]